MMFRTLLKPATLVFLLTLLITAATLFVGELVPAEVLLTTSTRQQTRLTPAQHRAPYFFTLTDLDRLLRVYSEPPLDGVRSMQLIYQNEEPLILIATLIAQERTNQEGLYVYNPRTGALKTLIQYEGARPKLVNIDNNMLRWSYDGERFAYYDSELYQIVVIDTVTGESSMVADVRNKVGPAPVQMNWSRKGDQIAFSYNNMLYVVNADGTNLRKFEQITPVYYYWLADDRYILVLTSHHSESNVIDAQTGEMVHRFEDLRLNGLSIGWGAVTGRCPVEESWIGYQQITDDLESTSYILFNLITEEEINLSEKPALKDEHISYVYWPDCETLHILTGTGNIYDNVNPQNNRIYTADIRGENIRFLLEGSLFGWEEDRSVLYYQRVVRKEHPRPSALDFVYEIYRQDLTSDVPDTLIGTHTIISPGFQWIDDDYKAAVHQNFTGRRTLTYVDFVEETQFILTPEGENVLESIVVDW